MYMYALKVHVPQSLALCADHDILFLISTFISCERICDRSLTDNIKAVKKFSERYEDRVTSFDCFYNPDKPSYVLVDVVTTSDIVHAMLWPGLAFVTGAVILSVYIFDIGINHVTTPLGGSPFNSLEKPWLRHIERNYEKVGTLSEYNAENAADDNDAIEDNDAHIQVDPS